MAKIIILILALVTAGIILINSRPGGEAPVQQPVVPLTSQEAVDKIKNLAAVKKYLAGVPNGRVDQSGGDGEVYLIQVYEIKDGHTATFNWYRVNKKTGEIKAELEIEENLALSKTYSNSNYKIEFQYPEDWQLNSTTQIFENGDIITVEKRGPTQKERTDFYDGVRFTVALPITSDLSLDDWVKKNFPGDKASALETNSRKFITTGDYYFTKIDGKVYGFFLFAQGEDKDNNTLVLKEILTSFSVKPSP